MRRVIIGILAGLIVLGSHGPTTRAAQLSKSYLFKHGVILELMAPLGDGVRLDTVKFTVPNSEGGKVRTAGPVKAEVGLSNGGTETRSVGIAIALFTDDGTLVGVASGGTKFLGIRPDRLTMYTLVFDYVNARIAEATRFQITVETR